MAGCCRSTEHPLGRPAWLLLHPRDAGYSLPPIPGLSSEGLRLPSTSQLPLPASSPAALPGHPQPLLLGRHLLSLQGPTGTSGLQSVSPASLWDTLLLRGHTLHPAAR